MRALGLLLILSAAAHGAEDLLARRLSDSVAVRIGAVRTERVLYHFSPTARLSPGDELEQGSSGHSELLLANGSLLELRATAHVIVEALGPEGDRFVFRSVTLGTLTALDRPLECELPGGTRCTFQGTRLEIKSEPGRLVLRNRGGRPIRVRGTMSLSPGAEGDGQGAILLGQGQEVRMPLFRLEPTPLGSVRETWSALALRHEGGFTIEPGPDALTVRGTASEVHETLTVAGVRVRPAPGGGLTLVNERRPVAPSVRLPVDDEAAGEGPRPLPPGTMRRLVQAGYRQLLLDLGYEVPDEFGPASEDDEP